MLSRLEKTVNTHKIPLFLNMIGWELLSETEGWKEKRRNDAKGEMIGKLARARSSGGSYHADRK